MAVEEQEPVEVSAEADQRLGRMVRNLLRSSRPDSPIRTPEALARMLAEQAHEIFDLECMVEMLIPDRPDHFRVVAASGNWAEAQLGNELPLAGTLTERAINLGRTVESNRAQVQSALGSRLASGDIETVRIFPLTTGEPLPDGRKALGAFGFYRAGSTPFTEAECALMDDYARLVTLSMHRAELQRAAVEHAERLRIGVETAVELVGSLEPHQVVRALLRRTVEAVKADRGTLSRIEAGELLVEDSYESTGSAIPIGARYKLPATGQVLEAITLREPIIGGAHEATEPLPESVAAALANMRHTVTVPLLIGGEPVAILVLSRRHDPAFDRSDLATLELLGNVAVLALRNAWLFTAAEEASRAKTDFLNMAAHELRTPLTVILGYLSMIRDRTFGEAPEPWQAPLDMVAAKAYELGQLVEGMLMAGRLESGTLRASFRRVDLRDVVREGLARAHPRVKLLRAQVSAQLPEKPIEVEADADQLGRILDNLINNALTYTRDPWIKLSVSTGKGSTARISVEDHGIGIPKEMRERIFERFFRLEDQAIGFQPGTGLGLSIGRELAHRHGGTLLLEKTAKGKGSTFTLVLPLAPS